MPVYLGLCSIRGIAVKKHRHVCGVSMSQMEWGGVGVLVWSHVGSLVSSCKIGAMAMICLVDSSRIVDQPYWSGELSALIRLIQ